MPQILGHYSRIAARGPANAITFQDRGRGKGKEKSAIDFSRTAAPGSCRTTSAYVPLVGT